MKRFLFTLLFIFTVTLGFAQDYRVGIKGGINLSHQGVFYSSGDPAVRTLTGFYAGGVIDIGFKKFSIQPGVFFSTKGNKESSYFPGPGASQPLETITKLNYIEVPVNLLYKIPVGENLKVFIGGGPYLAYALSGGWYVGGQKLGDIVFGGDNNYKRFDYGINTTSGFELKNRVVISAGYGIGSDLYPNSVELKNHVISFSVGYLFK